MAILKCKMCGGDLNITADEKIIECEYCGSTQTIPDGSDEKKTNLFNRANRLRIANEFDKAAGIYESIIAEFPDEAESYWGLCLCKFGIEYVDDPKTAKKIPTCHRTSFESIFDDENYKMVIEKSDVIAQGVYKEEATVIDNLQKDILSIVHKEEPFDVFICYKETDELGQRTQDSVLAQDIYDALTDKGFKVFFSRITLEDKLGKQYEPYIFAALNSAKVMLAIGTKEEYYNAVWVKNEWSRYLALMETDKSKMLIPCYRDIDPYDMPQEFKNLQGQDTSKLGFLQDLVRGISKIVAPEQNKPANAELAPTTSANATVDSLLKRAFMFLEDGNWQSADEYCEKVLDINPECAEAYLGKLMAELFVNNRDELKTINKPFNNSSNWQKVLRYGSEELVKDINDYLDKLSSETRKKQERQLKEIEKIRSFYKLISATDKHTVVLKADGTVEATLYKGTINIGHLNFEDWSDIIAVSSGNCYTAGLKSNGSVVVTKYLNDMLSSEPTEVNDWTEIISVSCGFKHIVGVKSDGTVVATKPSRTYYCGECDVKEWSDIVDVSAGTSHTLGLKSNGTVVATTYIGDYNFGQCDVEEWFDIVAVSAGSSHSVGLKSDGTVVSGGENKYGQCNTKDWTDIIAISAGMNHTVGLKSDGTVVAVGANGQGQCEVDNWTDIVAISAGSNHTVGIKSDGTIVSVGKNSDGQCNVDNFKLFDEAKNFDEERRIKTQEKHKADEEQKNREEVFRKRVQRVSNILSAGNHHIAGVQSDGTVVAVGSNEYDQCEVLLWREIVSISSGDDYTVGLKSDGTVVTAGYTSFAQEEVLHWTDIVAVSAGDFHTVGLKSDGTVVVVGENEYGQCNVSDWENVVAVSASDTTTVGLKKDGTVIVTPFISDAKYMYYGQDNVSDWKNIIAISAGGMHTVGLKSDGTVVAVGSKESGKCNVSDWKHMVAISAGGFHTVGLKSDGTVVAVGSNEDGQCNVSDWENIVGIYSGDKCTLGVKLDGTIVYAGSDKDVLNNIQNIKLFNDFENIDEERRIKVAERMESDELERQQAEEERIKAEEKRKQAEEHEKLLSIRRSEGKCQHCGGDLKGLFSKKCVNCGKKKDY